MTSVVICAYTLARWGQLQQAVESVARQTSDLVIVVDHNDALLERCVARWPNHRVVPNRHARGLSGARNTGVSEAAEEVIAFLDDDAVADRTWLEMLTVAFADPTVGGAGGHVEPAWAGSPPRWLPREFWWVLGCSYTGLPSETREVRNPIGANMAFRRSVFEQVGGFREEIGRVGTTPLGCEETELSIRARAAGFTVWYRPDAIVHHWVPPERVTVRYFFRRCYAEGLSKAVVSALAGRGDGLASERVYVTRTLPAAAADALAQLGRGPARLDGLARLAALAGGVLAAVDGFVHGTIAYRRRPTSLGPAPSVPSRIA